MLPREERHEEVKQVRAYWFVVSVSPALCFIFFCFWFICIKVTLSTKELFENTKTVETEKQKEGTVLPPPELPLEDNKKYVTCLEVHSATTFSSREVYLLTETNLFSSVTKRCVLQLHVSHVLTNT